MLGLMYEGHWMKEGLEEFLKRIEAKPTNETLIDRFITLVLEENGLERIAYLKKLVGLLLSANPYAALKAAALELQEARKENLTKEYEIGALKDVESCFIKLEKQDNVQLIREEILKIQGDSARDSMIIRSRTVSPNPSQPILSAQDQQAQEVQQESRQARVHFHLPKMYDVEAVKPSSGVEFAKDNFIPNSAAQFGDEPKAVVAKSVQNLADLNFENFAYSSRPLEVQAELSVSAHPMQGIDDRNSEYFGDEKKSEHFALKEADQLQIGPNILDDPRGAGEPAKPRSIASVFVSTDYESSPTPKQELQNSTPRRQNFDLASSKSIFGESQQVQFPDSTAYPGPDRREGRGVFAADMDDNEGADAKKSMEAPASEEVFAAPSSFDSEDTAKLDPEAMLAASKELMAEVAVPAFPPRDFDIQPDIPSASRQEEEAKARSKSFSRDISKARRKDDPPIREAALGAKEAPVAFGLERRSPELAAPPVDLFAAKRVSLSEPRWSLLRDRLRLLSGIQISRTHAQDFIQRLLGEKSSQKEQQSALGILLKVLDSPMKFEAEHRFLVFLFEELQPKPMHKLLAAMKIGDQAVEFFTDYLQILLAERQYRRSLNVIHAVIISGLDLSWYQEAHRFMTLIWSELGLKAWDWLEEEGPMVFCERLAEREDLLLATLLA